MKAIIMAGGEGTRLRPLTCDCPKPMLNIMGKPMMEYALRLVKRCGIREAGVMEYILNIYGIDNRTRQKEIDKVLQMDCRQLGRNVLTEFIKYINETNEQAFSEMLAGRRRK
ncbi:MAG: NTP transferase domain-containing protein [Clostridia bacterium]|nr:NTP transferase domain-containing protein [Clostridia bacterium]